MSEHKKENKVSEANIESDAVLTANACSGSLQLVPLRLSHGSKICDTLAICDTGSTLSFIDQSLQEALGLQGSRPTLNIAGINGTK